MPAGSVIVDLLLKTGSFETDTKRASKAFQQEMRNLQREVKQIGDAFAGYLSIDAFKNLVKGSIDAQDHLNDLSKKTGIAVDSLGGIGFAAEQSGGSLDSAAAGASKLNKSLAEAAAGNEQAAEAFKLLGIAVKDAQGNTISADNALVQLANKFQTFPDGPEKSALAVRIFGKAGADMIPLLDEGGRKLQENIEYFKRYAGVTAETAAAADEFNDQLTKAHLLQQAFGNNLSSSLLPLLKTLVDRFVAAKEEGDGFKASAEGITRVMQGLAVAGAYVIDTFKGVGREIGAVAAQAALLDEAASKKRDTQGFFASILDPFGSGAATNKTTSTAYTAISDAVKEDGERAKKDLAKLVNQILNPFAAGAFSGLDHSHTDKLGAKAPRLKPTNTGPKDDPTKKALENQLKAFERQIDAERDLLQSRNDFIELYNSQNLLSIKDYYAARQAAQDEATQNEIALYDKEIAALQAFKAKSTTSQVDKEGAEGKIADAIDKRARLEKKAGAESIRLAEQQRFAQEALEKQFQSVNAQVLELGENFAAAATIRFDLQFDALKKTFTAEGNAAGLKAIETLRAAAIAQAAFQKASLDASRTQQDLANLEDRIALAQQTGALTSLGALIKLGEVRRAQIPILEAQVAAEEAIARASGDQTLIRNAEAARLALDKLKASADPLAESLNKAFGDDLQGPLDDFVTGVKSASDAFEAFGKNVLNTILKLGTKSLVESIFGGSGGVGGFLSGILGGGSILDKVTGFAGGTAAGALGSLGSSGAKTAETAAVAANTTAMTALTAAATSAAAALEAMTASSAASGAAAGAGDAGSLASLFEDFGGYFADGGYLKPGQVGIAGEKGKELVFGGRTGKTIVPVGNGSTTSNVYNINVPVQAMPGVSTQTALQQGVAVGQGVQRAMARNG